MSEEKEGMSRKAVNEAKELRFAAMSLQLLEGNPLDAEDIAMFEMFESEAWPHDKRRAYILSQVRR